MRDQLWARRTPGPFESAKEFNNAVFALEAHISGYPEHPVLQAIRQAFCDSDDILFTHTDRQPKNILMSATGTDVLAFIDWEESGWYTECWEYVKMPSLSWLWGDWDDYVDDILQPAYTKEYEAIEWYGTTGVL